MQILLEYLSKSKKARLRTSGLDLTGSELGSVSNFCEQRGSNNYLAP
jgi:hypothetical protein